MGIPANIADFLDKALGAAGLTLPNVRMAEMGAQTLSREMGFGDKTAKEWLLKRGIGEHVSFDLNGLGGSVAHDLQQPVPDKYRERFNVVTNFGTIEHVEDHWAAFCSAHDLCAIGGIMIHTFPMPDARDGRWAFRSGTIRIISALCDYKTLLNEEHDAHGQESRHPMRFVCFGKTRREFPTRDQWRRVPVYDKGADAPMGVYETL